MTIKLDGVFHEPGNRLVLTCEVYTTVQLYNSTSAVQPNLRAHLFRRDYFFHSFAQVSLRVRQYNQTKGKELNTLRTGHLNCLKARYLGF